MALQVIGPGFGRTGTTSCKAALERLGFAPCYHMLEVYEHPGHVAAWSAIIDGGPPDWTALLGEFRAAVDWPVCSYWKQLKAANPGAKIVLTRRDPEAWYESMRKTIFQALRAPTEDEELAAWRVHTRKLIFEETFGNDLGYDNVVRVRRAHEADVIASVAPAELLVYDVGEGWEPLCTFLGVPVPSEPFPRINTATEFRQRTGLDPV